MATVPTTVQLTVVSRNYKNVSSTPTNFVISKMSAMQANLNPATGITVSDSSATANLDHSTWTVSFSEGVYTKSYLYWKLSVVSTTATLNVYDNSAMTHKVASGTCTVGSGDVTCQALSTNMSGISASVTVKSAAATDAVGGTLTVTSVPDSSALGVNGATQFVYREVGEKDLLYTVSESVSTITAMINGTNELITTSVDLTSAQILASKTTPIEIVPACGAGYVNKLVSAFVVLHGATGYAANKNATIVCGTAYNDPLQATATNGWDGTTEVLTNFVLGAGTVVEDTALSVSTATGDPTTGTGTATIHFSYMVVAI